MAATELAANVRACVTGGGKRKGEVLLLLGLSDAAAAAAGEGWG